MATLLSSKFLTLSLSAVLFVLLFPVLDFFTHPISVMYGEYVPLVITLSDFYWQTPVLAIAMIGAPVLLVCILLLSQWRQLGLPRSAMFVLLRFAIALIIEYEPCSAR